MRTIGGNFRFEKWYFDCVTSDGVVLIGYAARLKWGLLRLNYGARLVKAAEDPLIQRQSLSFGTVNEAGGAIAWANDSLNVHGEWTRGDPIPRTVVLNESSGRIEWQCLGANCVVHVCSDGQAITGTGYVERLTMTIPPWLLPFTELRWGRFISGDRNSYMVWIDIRGVTHCTWVWIDSAQPIAGTVDGEGVHTDLAELIFLDSQTLRKDNLARTLLGRFQFLRRLLPGDVSAIQEDKQVSKCVLKIKGLESKGSSIHEVVTWS